MYLPAVNPSKPRVTEAVPVAAYSSVGALLVFGIQCADLRLVTAAILPAVPRVTEALPEPTNAFPGAVLRAYLLAEDKRRACLPSVAGLAETVAEQADPAVVAVGVAVDLGGAVGALPAGVTVALPILAGSALATLAWARNREFTGGPSEPWVTEAIAMHALSAG